MDSLVPQILHLHRFFSVSVYYKEKVQFQTNGIEPFFMKQIQKNLCKSMKSTKSMKSMKSVKSVGLSYPSAGLSYSSAGLSYSSAGLSYSSAGLYSHYLLYAFHGTEFLDECICLCCIIYHHGYVSGEQAVLG